MSNLFSNYFGGGGSGSETSRFVGQVVDLGEGHKLKIKKVIAEGEMINCRTETCTCTLTQCGIVLLAANSISDDGQ